MDETPGKYTCADQQMKRYTAPPQRFDKAEFGTTCSVLLNDSGSQTEIYIQVSEDENDIRWIPARDLLFAVYQDNLTDGAFLQDLLDMYRALNIQ